MNTTAIFHLNQLLQNKIALLSLNAFELRILNLASSSFITENIILSLDKNN